MIPKSRYGQDHFNPQAVASAYRPQPTGHGYFHPEPERQGNLSGQSSRQKQAFDIESLTKRIAEDVKKELEKESKRKRESNLDDEARSRSRSRSRSPKSRRKAKACYKCGSTLHLAAACRQPRCNECRGIHKDGEKCPFAEKDSSQQGGRNTPPADRVDVEKTPTEYEAIIAEKDATIASLQEGLRRYQAAVGVDSDEKAHAEEQVVFKVEEE